MKILYLCVDPGIDLAGEGGGSIHIRAFVRALSSLGHQVTVVCSSAGNCEEIEAHLQATVRPALLNRWNRALVRAIQVANCMAGRTGRQHPDLVRILHNLTFGRKASAVAREVAPDFIYERYSLWGQVGLKVSKKRAIPLVLEVNAALAQRVERTVYRGADLLVAVSEALRQQLLGAGVPAERIRILPNAADAGPFRTVFDGGPVRRRFHLGDRFTVGFAGTFKQWHGVAWLLSVFGELHRADHSTHLLLVGDGPLRPFLEEAVRKAGIQYAVTFTGQVAHEEMPYYLAAMDVAVAPYAAMEGLYYSPLKLFEYMAARRAIVASRVGQIAEVIVDGETGLLFEPGDRSGLLDRIRRLRHDAVLRQELGRRAGVACRQYTWSQNAARLIEWVEALDSPQPGLSRLEAGEQHIG